MYIEFIISSYINHIKTVILSGCSFDKSCAINWINMVFTSETSQTSMHTCADPLQDKIVIRTHDNTDLLKHRQTYGPLN